MALWFRFYSDAMRHPKVAKLTDAEFRLWVELLAVASDNDGLIPPLSDLKHVLKRRLDHLSRGLEGLLKASLIDPLDAGYEPHGWSKRQYKSDTSTDRVKKFREKCNVSVTPPETEPDTETEPEEEDSCPSNDEPALKPEHIFERWNETAATLSKPRVRDLTPERRQLLKARIAQYALDDFLTVFGKIEGSAFLRGDTGWRGCAFDWVFKKANFQKILEGNYDE